MLLSEHERLDMSFEADGRYGPTEGGDRSGGGPNFCPTHAEFASGDMGEFVQCLDAGVAALLQKFLSND